MEKFADNSMGCKLLYNKMCKLTDLYYTDMGGLENQIAL